MSEYTYHPAADAVPRMTPEERGDLLASIKRMGLQQPIWLYAGQIIDGRHRYEACRELGIEPEYVDKTPVVEDVGPFTFVASMAKDRRSMDTVAKLQLMKKVKPQLEEEARARQGWKRAENHITAPGAVRSPVGESASMAGELVGLGKGTVAAYERVEREAPELFEMVNARQVAPRAASTFLTATTPEQRASIIAAGPDAVKAVVGDYRKERENHKEQPKREQKQRKEDAKPISNAKRLATQAIGTIYCINPADPAADEAEREIREALDYLRRDINEREQR